MLFLSTSDIPTCQLPFVLEIIYFGKLILNIITVVLPIALILLIMIDFTKCLITGNDSDQKKITTLAFKRILYSVVVFAVPYVVSLLALILSDLLPDYNLCITNATPENIAIFTEAYEKELEIEKQEYETAIKENLNNEIKNNIGNFDFDDFENLSQHDSRWKDYPLCTNKARGGTDNRTISTSACGFVSFNMILRSYGYLDIYPPDVVDVVCDELNAGQYGCAYWTDFEALSNYYGMKYEYIDERDYTGMEKALREGKRLIVLIPGHYISILGIRDDNTVIVGDSSRGYNKKGPYTIKSLAANAGLFYEHVIAIWKD